MLPRTFRAHPTEPLFIGMVLVLTLSSILGLALGTFALGIRNAFFSDLLSYSLDLLQQALASLQTLSVAT